MPNLWRGIAIASIWGCVAISAIYQGPIAIPISVIALFATMSITD